MKKDLSERTVLDDRAPQRDKTDPGKPNDFGVEDFFYASLGCNEYGDTRKFVLAAQT